MNRHKTHLLFLLILLFVCGILTAQSVTPWLTTGTKSTLLQPQSELSFRADAISGNATIAIDSTTVYQTMDGFGFCLTEGSAEVLSSLPLDKQDELLKEFFDQNTGIGISVLRISIGASDLSSADYTYNDGAVDLSLSNFSLNGLDRDFLIPILKKIVLINPNIKILATPWTAPRWMKSNQSWIGGTLNPSYYSNYAKYFVKYFEAMRGEGLEIWAITPQNEPLHQGNDPSMGMSSSEQVNFINNYLGPEIKNSAFSHIKIIAYDHNCDNTAYPIYVCNNSSYVDGSAFHLYAGSISALSTVKNATNKNVYFTEQYTGVGGNFSGDFGWHLQNVVVGAANNWAKAIIEWNLASNSSAGPHTPGGCTTCLGALTVNTNTTVTRNVSYYIIGQISKFVKPGALRIKSSSSNSAINCTAYKNLDGSMALLAYNSSSSTQILKVSVGQKAFNYSLSGLSAATFVWRDFPANIASIQENNRTLSQDKSGRKLSIKSSSELKHLTIFSTNGMPQIDQEFFDKNNFHEVDISGLSKGVYVVKLMEEKHTRTVKLIKK